MTEAIIYARFSSADQVKGHSIDRQIDNTRLVCEARNLTINPSLIFTEKGKSAFTGANRRKGTLLRNLEDEIEAGAHRGRTLVVEHLDRISRQGWKEVFGFLGTCNEGGVNVATWDGSRLYPAGQEPNMGEVIEIIVKSSSAQEQSDTKSWRIKKSFREKREDAEAGKSKRIASRPPSWIRRLPDGAGYELMDKPEDNRAAVVREAHRLAQAGHGTAMIAKIFNEKNVPTWRDGTKRKDGTIRAGSWHESYIGRMLTMRTAIGEYTSTNHGTRILGYYPHVITVEEYNRTQAARAKRAVPSARGRRGTAQTNVLQGIARCSHCGGAMNYKPGVRVGDRVKDRPGVAAIPRNYLKCVNTVRRVTDAEGKRRCSNGKGIRYERLESAVLDQIMTIALDNDRYNVTEISATRTAVAETERELEHQKEQLANVKANLKIKQSLTLIDMADELVAQIAETTSKAMALSKALTREDGAQPSSAFLARIKATRVAMSDPDHDTRRDARTMVHDSLKEVVSDMLCDGDGNTMVIIAHGLAAFRVTDAGTVDWHHDSSNDPKALKALTTEAFEENKGMVEWIVRRAKQANASRD